MRYEIRWSGTALLALLLVGACSGNIFYESDTGGGGDGSTTDLGPRPHKLAAIYLTPLNKTLEIDLNKPATVTYSARGAFEDGKEEDLTNKVSWKSSNPTLGAFVGATLKVPPMAKTVAAVTKVTATYQGLTGRAQLTVVSYRKSGAKTDFFFILPYKNDGTGKQQKLLDFSTNIQSLDVFFAMDVTGSMTQEIKNLQTGLKTIVIPGVHATVKGTWFGAGAFMDFPMTPYGNAGKDQPFVLFQTITSNTNAVQQAVNKYSTSAGKPIGHGGDLPESLIEALFQISTGLGLNGPGPTKVAANHSGVGGVGFRKGSMPVVLAVTDAMTHAPGESGSCSLAKAGYAGTVLAAAHSRAQAKAALKKICGRVVGIAPQLASQPTCSGLNDLEDFAKTTGAMVPPDTWDVPARPPNCSKGLCCTGINGAGRPATGGLCPLVFETTSSGSGLSASVVSGIQMLARYAPFDVTTQLVGASADINGKGLPSGKTSASFIKSVKPKSFVKPPAPPKLPDPQMTATGFSNVSPGTKVSFTIEAHNDFLKPTGGEARIFRAVIKVLAGECTDLDQREVFILVPPAPIIK